MVLSATISVEEEQRAKRRQMWLERAGRELEIASAWETSRDPGSMAAHLDRMLEIADKSDALTPDDKRDLRERARVVKAKAYQRYLDVLLEEAMTVTRDKERVTERGALLRQINEAIGVVSRLGVGDDVKQRIKDRIDIIMQTSAAGDGTTAKLAAEREAARVEAVAHPKEQRTFTRWRRPPIVVAIGGRTYSTLDWSLGGALLEEVDDRGWKPGQPIEAKIKLDGGKVHADKLEVVRYVPENRRLAIRTRRFASVFMQIKRDCDAAGMEPV